MNLLTEFSIDPAGVSAGLAELGWAELPGDPFAVGVRFLLPVTPPPKRASEPEPGPSIECAAGLNVPPDPRSPAVRARPRSVLPGASGSSRDAGSVPARKSASSRRRAASSLTRAVSTASRSRSALPRPSKRRRPRSGCGNRATTCGAAGQTARRYAPSRWRTTRGPQSGRYGRLAPGGYDCGIEGAAATRWLSDRPAF